MSSKFVHISEILKIEKEKKQKFRQNFDCGEESLNDYIQKFAKNNSIQSVGQTHLLIESSSSKIIGYYTLSNCSLKKSFLSMFSNFPVSEVPGILIGRLAIDNSEQRKGYGQKLMVHALGKIQKISQDTAVKIVVVDALNNQAKSYYTQFGFKEFDDEPMKLFMSIETVNSVLSEI